MFEGTFFVWLQVNARKIDHIMKRKVTTASKVINNSISVPRMTCNPSLQSLEVFEYKRLYWQHYISTVATIYSNFSLYWGKVLTKMLYFSYDVHIMFKSAITVTN
jgi:hypothetical protein